MIRAALFAGIFLAAIPVGASDALAQTNRPASGGTIGKATASQNLDCAVWASFHLNQSKDPGTNTGLIAALAWFSGLYEGQTGKTINAPIRARMAELTTADIVAIGPACSDRMTAFARRVDSVGS